MGRAQEQKDRFPSEAALCTEFVASLEHHGGWTVYPETAGFDLLCVYDKTGHQLGIEAKLQLNAKVADQILPGDYSGAHDEGPDFRAVLVPIITDSSHGIARMLRILGVMVFEAQSFLSSRNGCAFEHALNPHHTRENHSAYDPDGVGAHQWWMPTSWHDWNPVKRCRLPEIVPKVAAGVPSPIQLTTWKIGALKVMAELEVEGFVTARSVRACGVDPRRFCASDGYLVPIGDGKWRRGTMPAFDQQHPAAYAEVLAKARAAKETAL